MVFDVRVGVKQDLHGDVFPFGARRRQRPPSRRRSQRRTEILPGGAGGVLAPPHTARAEGYKVPGGNSLGRNSGTLGNTMIMASTRNIGTSMISVSFSTSTMRILAIAQAIIRHSP